ncbi:MAG: class C sortase [Eubacterium sp.]|nr:class C sortase [Eubacterium sp.]
MSIQDRIRKIALWLGFSAIALMLTLPQIFNAYNDILQQYLIGGYQAGAEKRTDAELEKAKTETEAYNRTIYERQKEQPFTYQGENMADDVYRSLLCMDASSNVMGSVRVPSAGIHLAIAHGTSSDDLRFEAGHLYGTSLPWGGKNTHAVIAGHTGLKSADLFTGLREVKRGDVFYIDVLDEIHEYTVDQIEVVIPEDEDPYLQIKEGEDLVTLYTCTPYGINDHRLMVRGHRTGTKRQERARGGVISSKKIPCDRVILFLLGLLAPVGIFFLGMVRYVRYVKICRGKQKQERVNETETTQGTGQVHVREKEKI